MTREEEIKIASIDYVRLSNRICPDEKSFFDGAEWADKHPKNIWHPSTELPRNEFIALLSDGEVVCGRLINDTSSDNGYAVFIYGDYVVDWSLVNKWVYVNDLLHKNN